MVLIPPRKDMLLSHLSCIGRPGQAAYMKILESSQTLLHVLKRETAPCHNIQLYTGQTLWGGVDLQIHSFVKMRHLVIYMHIYIYIPYCTAVSS